jgi:hypothetical protein
VPLDTHDKYLLTIMLITTNVARMRGASHSSDIGDDEHDDEQVFVVYPTTLF